MLLDLNIFSEEEEKMVESYVSRKITSYYLLVIVSCIIINLHDFREDYRLSYQETMRMSLTQRSPSLWRL